MKYSLLFSLMSLCSYAMALDAPAEEFYIDPAKIHPQALKDVKGIVMITFAELDYYIHFKTPPAKIQGYLRQDGLDSAYLQLSMKNVKPLSGVDYMQMTLRRFPVVN